ncbi:HtaA domain-containing protein [Streptomyces sp. cmx-18-6]|uniref:HtaA domain-containing protein n=1 Tax=Streptomyces sp. cmx-18-6 TaxID=2790930 RepID=UPI00398126D9
MSMPRRSHLAALAALTVVSVGAGVLAVPASAAPSVIAAAQAEQDGTATAASPILVSGASSWALKSSWVQYVTNMGGSITVGGGATQGAAGLIEYPVKHGSVDPAKRSANVRFGGSVTYSVPKHNITGITLANPRIVLANGEGTLYTDVTTDLVGQDPVTAAGVPIADLRASASALDGATLDWTGITATLTAKGADIFAYQGQPMYPAGTALEPLAIAGGTSVPTLTVSQVTELGEETQVTVTGKGYQPGRGVYLAQSIALPGNTFPSVYGNAAWVRQVGADGSFTATVKLTETFTPSGGAAAVDCRTTACFVTSFNSHDGADSTWMASRAQDVAQKLTFGTVVPSPVVTQHPTSRTARSGATATFVAAGGNADSVRWERSTDRGANWSPVAGATSTSLSVKASGAIHGHQYRAVFVNASGEAATSAATLTVTKVPARIQSFNASPEPVAKGGKLKVVGTLQTAGATDNTWRPLAKTSAVIEFQAKGAKTWSRVATVTGNGSGVFSASVTAQKDGTWRARYAGTADRAAAVSSSDYVDVKLRTSVAGFNASPEPVRKGRTITVKGTLRSLDGTWKNTSGQSVTVLFKADGAKKWSKLATVRTNSRGVFSKGFTAKKDGTWKAQYAATSARLGTTSNGDHVDVR